MNFRKICRNLVLIILTVAGNNPAISQDFQAGINVQTLTTDFPDTKFYRQDATTSSENYDYALFAPRIVVHDCVGVANFYVTHGYVTVSDFTSYFDDIAGMIIAVRDISKQFSKKYGNGVRPPIDPSERDLIIPHDGKPTIDTLEKWESHNETIILRAGKFSELVDFIPTPIPEFLIGLFLPDYGAKSQPFELTIERTWKNQK
jgi:hypothetical protein